jgi:transketolase
LRAREQRRPRPLDLSGLRDLAAADTVVLVEPYLAGTSTRLIDEALSDRPHRTLALGVGRADSAGTARPSSTTCYPGWTPPDYATPSRNS